MRFFRSTGLQRILPFLLLFLLTAGPFGALEEQREREADLFIQAPQFLAQLSGSVQQPQIKYGFYVIHVTVVPTFKKIISIDYIQGTSFDPLSANFLTYPDRGPPHLQILL